jgi:glycerol-3-phosphate responsive antiterminator
LFKLPPTVRIGPVEYTVELDQRSVFDGAYGAISYGEQCIRLMPGMPPTTEKATLIHEMLHGILFQAGMRQHDEQVIDAISYGILDMQAQNPGLFE